MLSSITPLGERGRGRRFGPTAAAYVAGSVGGASLLGAALGALGELLPGSWQLGGAGGWSLVALAAVVGVVFDLRVGGVVLPTIRRQVNENWLPVYRGFVVGLGFGVQLGLGVVTIVTSSLVYLSWLIALLSGSAITGAAVGVAFGSARAIPVLAMRGVHRPEQLAAAHRRLASWGRPAHRAAVATGALVAVLGLAAAVAA